MNNLKGKVVAGLAAVLILGGAVTTGTVIASTAEHPATVAAAPVLYNQDTVTSIYDMAKQATMEIQITQQGSGFYGNALMEGQGSGFLIDNQGHIVTNNHVVDGATDVKVVLDNGDSIDAQVLGRDSVHDLAVIGVDPTLVSGITPLQFADSDNVQPGQMAIAVGSPLGLNDSITLGVISGLNRTVDTGVTGMLQTDAALYPGNSGGPLLDADGNVIGINTAVETTQGAGAIGFAIPSNIARDELSSLIAGDEIVRPWLGISGLSVDSAVADSFGINVDHGVYVANVVAGGPAEKAGLQAGNLDANGTPDGTGDVITAVDNNQITDSPELAAYVAKKHVGDAIGLTVVRDGETMNLTATLEAWPDTTDTTQSAPVPGHNMPFLPFGPGR